MGTGLLLVLHRLPLLRQSTFAARVEPQLRSVRPASGLLLSAPDITPFGPLERILRPLLHDAVRRMARFSPANRALGLRLQQAGGNKSVSDYRAEQVLFAGSGFLAGGAVGALLIGSGRMGLVSVALGTCACAVTGFLLRDYLLTRQIERRNSRILAEFPSLAEMMALAVSAGESAVGALERVSAAAQGELADEFNRVLALTRSGHPLTTALQEFSDRIRLAPLTRFVDGVTVAVDRGTPLADVMRAQAQDVRDGAKRDLMETAGKKEIAMMVPVVFGILPLTVLFAVFPGLALLRLGL
ncbi:MULTISPECIES: type II secretion system F family protein [Arthrobacter]|uniref:Type II secretion system F family protein n=1 Tax=Arthrobacter jinronghuae TaxID=2964609 RepID=A0ABT1NP52_9MICC|nr:MULTISPECIES: type II secretion system F family protein [Arthrobacter]MCQ1949510.1 type II secretion system F family protein [Arthrobacter jinronghuae]MCQ1952830.1 type II secretion system F family protein [Arthrobacter sp. zg-Y238]MCQ1955049.1 type II secretion system F family protein [Arthrobacter jinronghuae]UWX77719.1 type II secretion system F family protein [Arthrobacter jinronghuae]